MADVWNPVSATYASSSYFPLAWHQLLWHAFDFVLARPWIFGTRIIFWQDFQFFGTCQTFITRLLNFGTCLIFLYDVIIILFRKKRLVQQLTTRFNMADVGNKRFCLFLLPCCSIVAQKRSSFCQHVRVWLNNILIWDLTTVRFCCS